MGTAFGIVIGLVVGVTLTGLFWWCYNTVIAEEARDPLAELNIDKEPLSTEETKKYLDQLVQPCIPQDGGGIAVGITVGGKSHVFGYGTTRTGGNAPDENSVFELASAGKTFTSLVLADMVLNGEVALDDAIEKFLPAKVQTPKYGDRGIRLVDLATQTSGLPRLPDNIEPKNPLNPYADYTVERMYDSLGRMTLNSPIGRSFEYSNLGVGLLGHILALKADIRYEDLIVARICEPLGMDSTRMTLDAALTSRIAIPTTAVSRSKCGPTRHSPVPDRS